MTSPSARAESIEAATNAMGDHAFGPLVKKIVAVITLVIASIGGTVGVSTLQNPGAKHAPVVAVSIDDLRAAQDRMTKETAILSKRIDALERNSQAQSSDIGHVSGTLKTLVIEVRENSRQTARVAGALEQMTR